MSLESGAQTPSHPSSGTWGIGNAPGKEIATLPPLSESDYRVPTSPRTGEPRRNSMVYLTVGLLYTGAIAAGASGLLAWFNMIQISGFNDATRLAGWVGHKPYEWETILTAFGVTGIWVLLTAFPAIVGYNAWCGMQWSRWLGLGAIAVAGLAFLMTRWMLLTTPLVIAGIVVLWLPPVGHYFREFAAFRQEHKPKVVTSTKVFYGPLPYYK